MSRLQIFWLHLSVALTLATGAVFAVMKYFLESSDEFSVVHHPLQPHMLAAHVVIAPIALFVLGWTFSNHMLPKYRFSDESRKSGIASMWLLVPMTLSGYLLQIASAEALREAMAVVHWISSGLFVAGYVAHLIVGRTKTGATGD